MTDEKGAARRLAWYLGIALAAFSVGIAIKINETDFSERKAERGELEQKLRLVRVVKDEPAQVQERPLPLEVQADTEQVRAQSNPKPELEYEIEQKTRENRIRDFSVEYIVSMNEGSEPWVYDDKTGKRLYPGQKANGNRTIGIGFNLEKTGAREKIEALGLNFYDVYNGRQKITEAQMLELKGEDIETARKDARKYAGENFDKVDENTQKVLTIMAYQMGDSRLSCFEKLRKAIDNMDYEAMAREMRDSRWYKQTGKPAYLVNMINLVEKTNPEK